MVNSGFFLKMILGSSERTINLGTCKETNAKTDAIVQVRNDET